MNLHKFSELNVVREKIGAPPFEFESSFDFENIDNLLATEGIPIENFDDVVFPDDGTIEYRGRKILVYIIDQWFEAPFQYKYHLAKCETIEEKIGEKKFNVRYVMSKKTTGVFNVNKVRKESRFGKIEIVETIENLKMPICKNCLKKLNYKGYNDRYRSQQREIFDKFNLDVFFETYKTQNVPIPKNTSENAFLNDYTDSFSSISKDIRIAKNWTCEGEECGINLKNAPKFLHVHHKDFDKTNNSMQNLQVLCIECHFKQDGHTHLAKNPDYIKFLSYKKSLQSPEEMESKKDFNNENEINELPF